MSVAGRSAQPSLLTNATHMGLDCLPMRCPSGQHDNAVSDGLTHREDEPCPFQADDFLVGPVGTCCSLRGKVAARELEALGEHMLSLRMYDDMTAEQALVLARELSNAARRLEDKHARSKSKPRGAGWNGKWNKAKRDWVFQDHSNFDEALSAIREAARWYEKVATLGFGVHAWY